MHPKLKTAILDYLANEYKLDPASMGEDFNFHTDLGLDPNGLLDLFQRLQDALDFSLPDEKLTQIVTIEDLFIVLGLDTDPDHTS